MAMTPQKLTCATTMAVVDYQAKYEAFLQEVLIDVNTKVQAAQQHAEENARASEEYSSELKQQLQDACERISQLEGRLAAAEAEAALTREQLQCSQKAHRESEDTAELLSAMSSLTVTVKESSPTVTVFHCTMVEKGLLGGHRFSLSLNKQTWEYTYDPLEPSSLPHLPVVKPFTARLCFPDYVISRFLTNLLNIHFSKEDD